jgi:hypothetical protein
MSNIIVNADADTISYKEDTRNLDPVEDVIGSTDYMGFTNNEPIEGFTNVEPEHNERIEETVEFKFISTIPGFEYSLKKSFCIFIVHQPDSVSIQSDEFGIYVTETDYSEALEVFFDLFVDDFYNWCEAVDQNLTLAALELKDKYLEYVRIQ